MPHQAVHVLAGASLPWAVRVAEVHSNACALAQLLVHGHLPSLVVRHAQAHRLGDAEQLFCERLQDVGSAGRFELRQLDQHDQTTGALDQGAHGAGIGRALDEIALPMPWELSILDLWWAHMDAQHVRDLTSAILPLATGHTLIVSLAHAGDQLLAQLAYRLGIDAVVDGLV